MPPRRSRGSRSAGYSLLFIRVYQTRIIYRSQLSQFRTRRRRAASLRVEGTRGPPVMFQGFASTAFVVGTLLTTAIPAVGLAQDHGGYGGNYGRSYSGGSH